MITITQEDKSIVLIKDQKFKFINVPFSIIVKDPFYVNFNCPVELESYSITEPLNGDYANVSIKFRNKTDKQISAIKFDVLFYNIFYEPIDIGNGNVYEVAFLDLQLEPLKALATHNVFEIPCSDNVRRLKVIVKNVVFDDGLRWLYNKEDLIEVETTLLDEKEIEYLRTVIGKDAICYPKMENQYWQCVCGNINTYDHDACNNCQRTMKHVFENAVNSKVVNDKYKQMLEKQEKQKLKERKSENTGYLVIIIGITIMLAYLAFVISQ